MHSNNFSLQMSLNGNLLEPGNKTIFMVFLLSYLSNSLLVTTGNCTVWPDNSRVHYFETTKTKYVMLNLCKLCFSMKHNFLTCREKSEPCFTTNSVQKLQYSLSVFFAIFPNMLSHFKKAQYFQELTLPYLTKDKHCPQ